MSLGYINHDLTFFKNIRMAGRRTLQFRMELYNAFNTTQYSNYNTNVQYSWASYQQYLATGDPSVLVQTNASVGLITAAREARRIQLGLRFTF